MSEMKIKKRIRELTDYTFVVEKTEVDLISSRKIQDPLEKSSQGDRTKPLLLSFDFLQPNEALFIEPGLCSAFTNSLQAQRVLSYKACLRIEVSPSWLF